MVTAGIMTLVTAILAAISNFLLANALEGIMDMYAWLGTSIMIDFTLINDIEKNIMVVLVSFMIVKIGFTVLTNYTLAFTDDRLAYKKPEGIILGVIKCVMAIVFIPHYVKGVSLMSFLLIFIIGKTPSFQATTLNDYTDYSPLGTGPLLLMVVIMLIAFVIVAIQFCLRIAEFIYSILSGYVFAIGLINDQAVSPAFNNWFTKVLGLGFINASQILCINLSAKALNEFFVEPADTYMMTSVGFLILCAATPATIKQIAHSTGLRSGMGKGFNMVRMIGFKR